MTNNNLRLYREKAGLSQVKLGCKAGIAPSMLSDAETGKRRLWPKARKALALVLKVKESELFPEIEVEHGQPARS